MNEAIRKEFPMLATKVHNHPFVYLDNAATSQKPQSVIDVISHFYAHDYGTVHRSIYSTAIRAGDAYQDSRKTVRDFLNAKTEDEIIFTRGTTEAVNLVASSFGKANIFEGDEIIITEMEHHSNIVPWQMCADERKARLLVVPFFDNGQLDLDAFKSMLSDKTKIVAVTHLSNVLGTVNPIKEIVELAHAYGAKVLVDGAQSAPHM
ncbi:MAG: aminotransferase class V-fold PLP-dependent enzyme, partial [Chlamydiales bacterium]|nr:aminotransferase class V-fold PLP-dependent enzyme [Chlamydiales bacterium]